MYGETNRQGMFFDRLLMGTLEHVTEHSRDFVHIDDVCDAIEILMNSDFKGTVDIGTGESNLRKTHCSQLVRTSRT